MSNRQAQLEMRFLGKCQILGPRGELPLESMKTRALLVFLALNPGPQSRHRLMGLLWEDFSEPNARRNLRHALWNLRKELGFFDESLLLTRQDTVSFTHPDGCWLDVKVFQQGIEQAAQTPNELECLQQAMAAYQGDFLAGFFVSKARSFDEWALTERERLRTLALLGYQRLVEKLTAKKEYETALEYAKKLLAMDTWREESHRQVMQLLAHTGQRAAALNQFECCRQELARELGVEPALETRNLYDRIRKGEFGPAGQRAGDHIPGPSQNLPAATTAFIGREKELARIQDLLADPHCRLLSLTGPGGVGKTRLALEAARRAGEAFPGGVFFIPLAPLGNPNLILPTILSTFGIGAGSYPRQALLKFLGTRKILLVVDNFEHLQSSVGQDTPGEALLSELLEGACGLKILVTSRHRLNLRAEWVFDLQGLSFPDQDPLPEGHEYDAERLFMAGASRASLGYLATAADRAHILRLCRIVEGNPLAIELAAAWARTLSPQEITQQIERNLDFLATGMRDLPPRQRSLRATFEHSWGLLHAEEKSALLRLAVFKGGFRQPAAQQIADVPPLTTSGLINKSLLQRQPNGRYQMHEVVRHYTEERLQQEPETRKTMRARHAKYYLDFLSRHENYFLGEKQKEALWDVGEEIDNLRAAWEWAVEEKHTPALEKSLESLYLFYDLQGWFEEGERAFESAYLAVENNRVEDKSLLAGRLLARRAVLCKRLGVYACAQENLQQALQQFQALEAHCDAAFTLNQLGNIADLLPDYLQAREYYAASLEIYQKLGDEKGISIALNNLGLAAHRLGDYVEAIRLYRDSLARKRRIGYQWGVAITLDNLANTYRAQGLFSEAGEHFMEALAIAWEIQALTLTLEILVGISEMRAAQEELDPAVETLFLVISHPVVTRETQARAQRILGNVAAELPREHMQQIQEGGKDLEVDDLIARYL